MSFPPEPDPTVKTILAGSRLAHPATLTGPPGGTL
jgi:hypothetical protein